MARPVLALLLAGVALALWVAPYGLSPYRSLAGLVLETTSEAWAFGALTLAACAMLAAPAVGVLIGPTLQSPLLYVRALLLCLLAGGMVVAALYIGTWMFFENVSVFPGPGDHSLHKLYTPLRWGIPLYLVSGAAFLVGWALLVPSIALNTP